MPLRVFKNHLFSHSCVDLTGAQARSIDGRSGDIIAVGFGGNQVALGQYTAEDKPKATDKRMEKSRSRSKEPKSKEKRSNLKRSASDGYSKSRSVKPPKEKNSSLKRSASDGHTKSRKVKPQAEAKPPKDRKATVKRSASDGHTKSKRIKPVPLSVSANGHVRVMERMRSTNYVSSFVESSDSFEHVRNPIIGRETGFLRSGSEPTPTLDSATGIGLAKNAKGATATQNIASALIKVDHVPSRPDSVSNGIVKIEHLATADLTKRAQLLNTNGDMQVDTCTAREAAPNGHLPSADIVAVSRERNNTLNVGVDSKDVKRHTACLSASRPIEPPEEIKATRRKSSGAFSALTIAGGLLRRKNKSKPDEVHWKRKVGDNTLALVRLIKELEL